MSDWLVFAALGALVISIYSVISRSVEKNLSIREYEAFIRAVQRETDRLENRLRQIEESRPTTGELQVLADSFDKRLIEMRLMIAKS